MVHNSQMERIQQSYILKDLDKKIVLLVGPRQGGKTWLAKEISKHFERTLYLNYDSIKDKKVMRDQSWLPDLDLLILDELGFKKLPGYAADDFFEVISRRYEKSSSIITTNKSFEQWGEIFGDKILSSAIFDRLIHHSVVFKIIGSSFRAKSIRTTQEKPEEK